MSKIVMLRNVRCSFPQLFEAKTGVSGTTFNPGASFILDPSENSETLEEIKEAIKSVIAENAVLKKSPPSKDKFCLRESDREDYPEGSYILKASNPVPPIVLGKNRERLTKETNTIYSGCYVNAKIEVWGQTNAWGKRVNAKLIAIQFAEDGEPFGAYISEAKAVEGFEDLEEAGEERQQKLDFM